MSTLYIVSTPIGNLEDITLRALRVLKEADCIACEDTRHTVKLLNHFGIQKKLISYFQGNELTRLEQLIALVLNGENVALVSDAGTPAISDPGFKLIREAIKCGIKIEVIPGPSAIISAVALSGLPTDQFTFVGFLPDKEGKRRKKLEEVRSYEHTLVFYVSKWKVERTLKEMIEILGDRPAVLCRELTKVYEEVKRGRLSELIAHFGGKEVKGEITLVVGWSDDFQVATSV